MDDPDDQWKAFHSMFISTTNVNAPWMKIRVKCFDVPYMNSDLRDAINENDKINTLANKKQDDVTLSRY